MEKETILLHQEEIRNKKERIERQLYESNYQRDEITAQHQHLQQEKDKLQKMAQKVTDQANQVQDRSRMAQKALEEAKQVEGAVHIQAKELEKERDRLRMIEKSLQVETTDLKEMKMDVVRQRVNFLKEKYRETE